MEFDLGFGGIGIVLGLALGFGVIVQVIAGARRPWMWLLGGVAYAIGALVASEWIFAWATVDDLQPMIDGLLFDEALFGGLVLGVPVVIAAWLVSRRPGVYPPLHG